MRSAATVTRTPTHVLGGHAFRVEKLSDGKKYKTPERALLHKYNAANVYIYIELPARRT